MVNLISPGTGHVIDPVAHAEQMRRIGEYAAKGIDHVAEAPPLRHMDAEIQPLPLAAESWDSASITPVRSWRRESMLMVRSKWQSRRTSRGSRSCDPCCRGRCRSLALGGGRLTCRSATKTLARAQESDWQA